MDLGGAPAMPMDAGAVGSPAMAMDPMGGSPAAYADPFQGMPVQDASAGMGGGGGMIPELTALREWESKHEQELEETARKEDADKADRRKAAGEQLTQWYEERQSGAQKRLEKNRADEA